MPYLLIAIFYLLPCLAVAAPFASWIDVKAECGAMGDGKADDTIAIQKGLDLMRPEDSNRKVLYFPAGKYRITGTIKSLREKHRESQGIGIQGMGADKSILLYDGQGNEPMLQWGAWYSTIRGLGFETADSEGIRMRIKIKENTGVNAGAMGGDSSSTNSQTPFLTKAAKPTAGIWFGPEFSTANEVSDCAFRDLPLALLGGEEKTKGQAEVAVERCVFERCGYGLRLANWNSLDWWFWDCEFTDCDTAVGNRPGCGEFRVYRSKFTRSKNADAEVGNLGTFALVENQSRGSRVFLSVGWGMTAGGNFTLQGNRVEGATSNSKIDTNQVVGMGVYMANPGPVLMLDNQFIRTEGSVGPDIYFRSANRGNPNGSALLIGNKTTGTNLFQADKGYDVRLIGDGGSDMGDRRTEAEKPKPNNHAISNIPYFLSSPDGVIEVEAGSTGEKIQAAIDGAKDGAVVHLPTGEYRLSQPVVIQAGKKVKIVGDGILNATKLVPDGNFGEKGLIQAEPGADLEMWDLALFAPVRGGGPLGILIKAMDQDGVVLEGDQVQTTGFGPGMVVEGLDNGKVVLKNHIHNGVTVFGGEKAKNKEKVKGRIEILCGASSRDANIKPETPIYDVRQGGKVMVRDVWYEGHPPEFMQVKDRGDILFLGGHIAPNKGKAHTAVNAIQLEGQSGSVLLAQAAMNGADLTIGQLAEGFFVTLFGLTPYPSTSIRYAGGEPTSSKTEQAGFVQLMCRQNNTKITGSEPLADVNAGGDIAERFRMMREWKLPDPNLDAPIKLHRVSCTGSIGLVVVSSQPKEK